jgi:translation initiation factor 3 subunit A
MHLCPSFSIGYPVINSTRSKSGLLEIDDAKQKQTRLSLLLSMGRAPSRTFLLKEAVPLSYINILFQSSKAVLRYVRPEIRELYNILEVEFHPLSICKKIEPVISIIAKDPDMAPYVKPLHQVILTRLFQQLSQVYESLHLNFVLQLATFPPAFEMDRSEIEKFIMSACKKGELSIRVDHANQLLTLNPTFFSRLVLSAISVFGYKLLHRI